MEKSDLVLLQHKVTMLRAEGKYQETIDAGYQLLKIGIKLNDYKSILTAHINNAASYYSIGAIEEAFRSIDAHKEISDKHGDEADQLGTYNILFLLYEYNKEYTDAKRTLKTTIEFSKRLGHYNITSNAYSNYSHILLEEENYSKALEMAEKGLQFAEIHEPVSPILKFRVKLNIAKSQILLGDIKESEALVRSMVNDPLLNSFIREKSQCYILQAIWYEEQKMYKEAFDSLTEAKVLVDSYNDVHLLKTIQQKRCVICDLMHDYETGYRVQKEYIALLDEIRDRDLVMSALKLNIKHRVAFIKGKADRDGLTGLYNRNYIQRKTNQWLSNALETAESIVCIAFDIDNLKSFNDEYGHVYGDEVIKSVSKVCTNILRSDDLIGRFGGDEFVIILRGTTLENGVRVAEKLLKAVRNLTVNVEKEITSITVSIGVTNNLYCDAINFIELFHSADNYLYKAKENGRNQICVS
ncbi:tetratricopeptide repeat-containing diguanylate cyclase [Sporosarcina sp. FA9]|uniref:tetratricopeptide repeat-containing diguanylate cyclase n=1 Tax=Sporosarcina sp. FA9 TaxID=3413030 RepID=UPI003F65DB72